MAERQHPTAEHMPPRTYADFVGIVVHPAVRLGFLDAQRGAPINHDDIIRRIQIETPPNALRRLGWDADIFGRSDVDLAQYRYEEGRLLVIQEGLCCKAWGHPDYPPAQIRAYIMRRATNAKATP